METFCASTYIYKVWWIIIKSTCASFSSVPLNMLPSAVHENVHFEWWTQRSCCHSEILIKLPGAALAGWQTVPTRWWIWNHFFPSHCNLCPGEGAQEMRLRKYHSSNENPSEERWWEISAICDDGGSEGLVAVLGQWKKKWSFGVLWLSDVIIIWCVRGIIWWLRNGELVKLTMGLCTGYMERSLRDWAGLRSQEILLYFYDGGDTFSYC